MNELDSNTYCDDGGVICPHCRKEKHPDAENLPWREDEAMEYVCNGCGKNFEAVCTFIRYTRESRKI